MSEVKDFFKRWRWAFFGGLVGAGLAIGGVMVTGHLGGAEGRVLLESVLPSVRFLSSGVLAAAATILALMLTALSISRSADTELERAHYREMEQIGWLTTATLVGSVLVLALASVPVTESDTLDTAVYSYLYIATMCLVASLTAAFLTVVIMLNISLRRLIEVVAPEPSSSASEPEEVTS